MSRNRRHPFRLPLLGAALLGLLAAGCGGPREEAGGPGTFRVILDFLPNPLHIGLYHAQAMGWYAEAGLDLRIDQPTSTTDTLRLMSAGRADLGYVPMIDFGKAREQGEAIVMVASVVQKPLAALHALAASGVARPRDLEGRVIGVSGVASDEATARSIVAHDGGDPDSLRFINIGFNVVQNLVAGRVDGAVGFWNHEGVQLRGAAEAVIFKEDEWGLPAYPGIIAFVRRETLQDADRRDRLQRFLDTTARGYAHAVAHPETALRHLAGQLEGATATDLRPHLEALAPVFLDAQGRWGQINEAELAAFLAWAENQEILSLKTDGTPLYINALFDSRP